MDKVAEFRQYARDCLDLAHNAGPDHRIRLLEMAHAWMKAADEAYILDPSETDARCSHRIH